MESEERVMAREKLDREMRYFRIAARKASSYPQWLKRVRQALGAQATEMARDLEVNVSVIHRLEASEDRQSISLRALEKIAGAIDCQLVYAIVPREGKTLMELAEQQKWMKRLGKG